MNISRIKSNLAFDKSAMFLSLSFVFGLYFLDSLTQFVMTLIGEGAR